MRVVGQPRLRTVLLIGTNHEYQYQRPLAASSGPEQFRAMVAATCQREGVRAITEEWSVDANERKGVQQSVCKEIADALGIAHRYCDPSAKERKALGILIDEADIQLGGFFSGRDPQEVEAEVRDSHARRRRYWLERLFELDVWPLLFVCGANHTEPFRELLQANGIAVRVLFAKWEPN